MVEQYEIITDVIFDNNDKMIDKSSDVGHDKKLSKSALALLKIHQLIEHGYGGNVDKTKKFWSISYDVQDRIFIVRKYKNIIYDNFITSFHTETQANEFLSYPENV